MKFEGVLVRPLGEQADRDGHKIDPAGVRFTEGESVPIWRDFSYDPETDLYGHGVLSRAEDGSIIVTGELTPLAESFVRNGEAKLAIGVRVDFENRVLAKDAGEVIGSSELMSIGITWEHQDPAQPVLRLLDEMPA